MLAKYTAIPWLILGLSMSGALLPQRALACSCSIAPIYRSDPADGAQNVPVNIAVLIMGAFRADSVVLEDANGEPVPFTFQGGPTPSCAGTSGDLIPSQPLRPNTRYVLKVDPLVQEQGGRSPSLTFTTGSGSLPDEEPTQPSATASVVYDVPPNGASCGMGTVRAGIEVKDWTDVEVIARRDDHILLHWMLTTGGGAFLLDAIPTCIDFRRRTRTGRRSAPATLCGEALVTKSFLEPPPTEPDDSEDATASDEAEGRSALTAAGDASTADGCSSAPGAPTTALPMLVGLLALSLTRRRQGRF